MVAVPKCRVSTNGEVREGEGGGGAGEEDGCSLELSDNGVLLGWGAQRVGT